MVGPLFRLGRRVRNLESNGRVVRMAAANDNKRRKWKKRERAEGRRAVATMTRVIQDLYGSYGKQRPVAERGWAVSPKSMLNR
jgi:hypothetical protein